MKKYFTEAVARFNLRLRHKTPVQLWLAGAFDALVTLFVIAMIVLLIAGNVQ